MATGTYTHTYSVTYDPAGGGTVSITSGEITTGNTGTTTTSLVGTGTELAYRGTATASGAVTGTVEYRGEVTVSGVMYYLIRTGTGTNAVYYLVGDTAMSTASAGSLGAPATGTDMPLCFVAGTMIATPSGEIAVEDLKAGDLVTLASGGTGTVTWLGRQTISTVFADPLRVQPIRIMAGAVADGVPSRDLLVSPDHALLVDGALVHASALVNGVSVVRETMEDETFVYYHVEVDSHALILAENTPAETFIDNVSRMSFDNWDQHPGDTALVEMELPRAKSARQLAAATSARLLARAERLFGSAAARAA